MTIHKLSKFLIALLVAGTFSCNSFLKEENMSGLTADGYYATAEGMEALINSCYTPMRLWYGKENGIALSETGTDIITRGNGMENPALAMYNSDLDAKNFAVNFHWQYLYSALNTCNTAIGRIGASPLLEANKKSREAEARFLRAFYLWHIVETWGGVHFSTEETKSMVLTANRTPVEKFYEQIFTDLTFAAEHLPPVQAEYGRVTRPAAEAFMARMHLTRKNYPAAAALAKKVISSYSYSLVPNYANLWNINNVRNPEVVWMVNFTADPILNRELEVPGLPLRDGGNNSHLFFLMTYDQVPGMQRDIVNGRPFARFMPTAYLLDLFDETKDARFNATFQTVWLCNRPGKYTINNGTADSDKREITLAAGDTAIFATKRVMTSAEKIAKKYTVIDRSRTYRADGIPAVRDRYISFRKFLDPSRLTISEQQSKRDAFVIRLAEMYMIVAEAELLGGNPNTGLEYINAVRRRAALPGKQAEMEITLADLTLDFILDERAREFAGEQLRWFDLKRTGKLVERVQKYNPDASANIKPFHTVRPIPQAQLDALTNKGEFTQNEGYN